MQFNLNFSNPNQQLLHTLLASHLRDRAGSIPQIKRKTPPEEINIYAHTQRSRNKRATTNLEEIEFGVRVLNAAKRRRPRDWEIFWYPVREGERVAVLALWLAANVYLRISYRVMHKAAFLELHINFSASRLGAGWLTECKEIFQRNILLLVVVVVVVVVVEVTAGKLAVVRECESDLHTVGSGRGRLNSLGSIEVVSCFVWSRAGEERYYGRVYWERESVFCFMLFIDILKENFFVWWKRFFFFCL